MANGDKETVYVDIDDEITAIIDKVHSADKRIVALVLPKRATVFQSVVNMKLLKRSAEEAKKHVVLITAEKNLLPLAGAVGLYVANSLQSKPEIPASPDTPDADGDEEDALSMEDEPEGDFDPAAAASKPVGELATKRTTPPPRKDMETLELDNEPMDSEENKSAAAAAAASAGITPKAVKGKNKKLKIPNFNQFRVRLIIAGAALILLILLWVLGWKVLPHAAIDIKTNATALNASLNATLDTEASSLNPVSNTVPAKMEQEQKTNTQQVAATGQKNEGNKATGTIDMSAQECAPNLGKTPSSVPAGTGVSSGGKTFITQQDASFTLHGFPNGNCASYQASGVSITAQDAGASYNNNDGNFSVAGRSDVSASGSTDGGSDNIVKVVQQSDVDNARNQLGKQDTSAIKKDLQQKLQQDGVYALAGTFNASQPNVTTSAQVGDQADNVTVTASVTYAMYGAQKNDLHKLIVNSIQNQIDTSKQSILDDGLSSANIKVITSKPSSEQISLDTTVDAGPNIDTAGLKQQVAGKKSGEISDIVKSNPGVTGVQVKLSPFWVTAAPSNPDKISIKIEKPSPPSS